MNRVVHFEIHAAEPERAALFYRDVFGWEIKEWLVPGVNIPQENRYWMVATGSDDQPGINGGIVVRRGHAPIEGQGVNGFICTIDVASLEESINKAVKAGASLAIARMPIKGVGWLAYCKDPEGNIFGMMQPDENAG